MNGKINQKQFMQNQLMLSGHTDLYTAMNIVFLRLGQKPSEIQRQILSLFILQLVFVSSIHGVQIVVSYRVVSYDKKKRVDIFQMSLLLSKMATMSLPTI